MKEWTKQEQGKEITVGLLPLYPILSVLGLLAACVMTYYAVRLSFVVNNVTRAEDILIDTYNITSELRVASVVDIFNKDGTWETRVVFRSNDFDIPIECTLPKHEVDRDAVYLADIKIEYINNLLEDYLKYGKRDVKDFVRLQSDWCTISNIDFMFSDYISSNFKTTDELKADFLEKRIIVFNLQE